MVTAPGKSIVPRGLDAREWRWRDVISTKWQLTGEHIIVLECQALELAMRWRFRDIRRVGTKFLRLVNAKVTLGVGDFSTVTLGFVCTHFNSINRPSRQEEKTTNTAAEDGQPTK